MPQGGRGATHQHLVGNAGTHRVRQKDDGDAPDPYRLDGTAMRGLTAEDVHRKRGWNNAAPRYSEGRDTREWFQKAVDCGIAACKMCGKPCSSSRDGEGDDSADEESNLVDEDGHTIPKARPLKRYSIFTPTETICEECCFHSCFTFCADHDQTDGLDKLADDEVAKYAKAFREHFSKRAPSGDSPVQHSFQEGLVSTLWERDREELLTYGKSLTLKAFRIKVWELVAISKMVWDDNTSKRKFPRCLNKAVDGQMIEDVNRWLKERGRPQLHLPSCYMTWWPCCKWCCNARCLENCCLSGTCPFLFWAPDKLYESDYFRSRCCKYAPWLTALIFVTTAVIWGEVHNGKIYEMMGLDPAMVQEDDRWTPGLEGEYFPTYNFWWNREIAGFYYNPDYEKASWWKPISCAVAHSDTAHLWGNLGTFLQMAPLVEAEEGPLRLLWLYVIGAVWACGLQAMTNADWWGVIKDEVNNSAVAPEERGGPFLYHNEHGYHQWWIHDVHYPHNGVMVGASGAISAIVTAHIGSIVINWAAMSKGMRVGRALYMFAVLAYYFYNFYQDYYVKNWSADGYTGRIAHAAHGGGALAGVLVSVIVSHNFRPSCINVFVQYLAFLSYMFVTFSFYYFDQGACALWSICGAPVMLYYLLTNHGAHIWRLRQERKGREEKTRELNRGFMEVILKLTQGIEAAALTACTNQQMVREQAKLWDEHEAAKAANAKDKRRAGKEKASSDSAESQPLMLEHERQRQRHETQQCVGAAVRQGFQAEGGKLFQALHNTISQFNREIKDLENRLRRAEDVDMKMKRVTPSRATVNRLANEAAGGANGGRDTEMTQASVRGAGDVPEVNSDEDGASRYVGVGSGTGKLALKTGSTLNTGANAMAPPEDAGVRDAGVRDVRKVNFGQAASSDSGAGLGENSEQMQRRAASIEKQLEALDQAEARERQRKANPGDLEEGSRARTGGPNEGAPPSGSRTRAKFRARGLVPFFGGSPNALADGGPSTLSRLSGEGAKLARKSKDIIVDYARNTGDKLMDRVSRVVSGGDTINELKQRLGAMRQQRDYLQKMAMNYFQSDAAGGFGAGGLSVDQSIAVMSGQVPPGMPHSDGSGVAGAGSSAQHQQQMPGTAAERDALQNRLASRKNSLELAESITSVPGASGVPARDTREPRTYDVSATDAATAYANAQKPIMRYEQRGETSTTKNFRPIASSAAPASVDPAYADAAVRACGDSGRTAHSRT